MDDLDFEYHSRRHYLPAEGGDDDERAAALFDHAIAVQTGLVRLIGEMLPLKDRVTHPVAWKYLVYGAARRLGMLRASFADLFRFAPPDRTEPLDTQTEGSINRDLNSIYIDVAGTMDNFAWVLLHALAPADKVSKVNRRSVGLFRVEVANLLPALQGVLGPFAQWHGDLVERRHVSAHRIPMYIPPSALSETEAIAYRELDM